MRAIWKGAVSFGLVNVPVKLYAATGEKDVKFHQVHVEDGGRIRYRRVCSVEGEEVPYSEIAKGFETDDGELVVLTDEDFAELPLRTGREIDVVEFVPSEQVDPIMFAKCYYLEPEKTALKPYALLREALLETDRMAVVKVALRQRETLAVLRVRDKVILLQTMLWPDEVRAADFDILDADVDLRPQELTMAASLVQSLAGDFDPGQFSDDYAAALRQLIEAKVTSGEVRQPPAESEQEGRSGEVVDLLTALQRSVDRARASRGEEPAGDERAQATTPSAAKAPAAKPPAAKPPAATKGPTSKTATTKAASTATKAAASKPAAKQAQPGKPAAAKTSAARTAAAKKPAAKKATRKSA